MHPEDGGECSAEQDADDNDVSDSCCDGVAYVLWHLTKG